MPRLSWRNSAIIGLMSTREEIEAAVQQLPPAKRAEFRDWFHSFEATDWDQQMEHDMTARPAQASGLAINHFLQK
jgi:hypothetical protein